jgi:hypothetical protein
MPANNGSRRTPEPSSKAEPELSEIDYSLLGSLSYEIGQRNRHERRERLLPGDTVKNLPLIVLPVPFARGQTSANVRHLTSL